MIIKSSKAKRGEGKTITVLQPIDSNIPKGSMPDVDPVIFDLKHFGEETEATSLNP